MWSNLSGFHISFSLIDYDTKISIKRRLLNTTCIDSVGWLLIYRRLLIAKDARGIMCSYIIRAIKQSFEDPSSHPGEVRYCSLNSSSFYFPNQSDDNIECYRATTEVHSRRTRDLELGIFKSS